MTAPTVVVKPVARRIARAPTDDETPDVTITKLRLASVLKSGGIDVDPTKIITDGSVEDSTTGAPQLTLDLLDRDLALMRSGIFADPVDVTIDGVPFRCVEPSLTAVDTVELLFEHKLVNVLRQFKSPLKAARASVTRAQFVEVLLREAAKVFGPITLVCPEISKQQPVAGKKKTGRSLKSKTLGGTTIHNVRDSGFGVSHLSIRHWTGATVTLGPSQLKNAATVMQVCAQLGQSATAKATEAVMCACIVEPSAPFENTVGGDGGSSGILQWVGKSFANDVVQSITHALQDPGATGRGGMISLAQKNPGWSPGQVAQAEQGSAFGSRYDQALTGARQVIAAFTNAGGFTATGINFGAANDTQFEFSRGQPGQTEDSWACIQRLATEVNWRTFIVGRNTVYFVTDDDLLAAETTYKLTPESKGVANLTYQIEMGGRTIRVHGRRQPKPNEMQLEARFDRWAAPPGGVIELGDYGPGDGRWIVIDATRPLFDTSGTISLQSPQQPLPEPAADTSSSAIVGGSSSGVIASGDAVDKIYAASQAIDRRNLPYIFGGGHTGSWASAVRAAGLDCSSSVSIVLWQAGLMQGFAGPIVSGDFSRWGQPGRGSEFTVWYTSGHVFIEFYGRPAKRFDTVPGGSGGNGPHLRFTAPGAPGDTWEATGFAARHWPGL